MNPFCNKKRKKIVGASIRTLALLINFTTVFNYDYSEIYFSKYKIKTLKKRVMFTVIKETVVIWCYKKSILQ